MQINIRHWLLHTAADFDSCNIKVSEMRNLQFKAMAAHISDSDR